MALTVPRAAQPIVLDGRLGDEEWGRAAALSGVMGSGGTLAPRQTTFFLQWQTNGLWVAARGCFPPGMMPARRNLLAISDMLEFCIQAPQKEGDDALVRIFFSRRMVPWPRWKAIRPPRMSSSAPT